VLPTHRGGVGASLTCETEARADDRGFRPRRLR
jgi:hypothetical protein